MSRSSRFFRSLWRVNAVLLFLMTAIITIATLVILVQEFGSRLARSAAEKVNTSSEAESPADEPLQFANSSIVAGSGVITVDFVAIHEGKGPSSGTTTSTRNVLFIEPDQKSAHWLLSDNAHELSEEKTVYDRPESDGAKVVGTAVIVKPLDATEDAPGRLVVYDRSGRNIVEVSKTATKLELASLSGSEIYVLYRNGARFVRATLDSATLAKRGEIDIDVSRLK